MSGLRDEVPKTKIRRLRTGCLTCRKRRVRCDEQKPECRNCSIKSRTCEWNQDMRFVYHPTAQRQSFSSVENNGFSASSATTSPFDTSPDSIGSQYSSVQLVDPSNCSNLAVPTPSTNTDSWNVPVFPADIENEDLLPWPQQRPKQSRQFSNPSLEHLATSVCRKQSDRLKANIDLEHASPIPPNLEPNTEEFSNWRSLGASDLVLAKLDSHHETTLLQNYLRECAPWFDVNDGKRHYSRKDIPRMMRCPPWRAAALALSAKTMELREQRDSGPACLSLHLYQLAVTLAIDSISGRFDCVGTTAGCVLLAVYEMMTVRYQDWRRHLQGCASIYSHNRWNGDSLGLIGASFWNYARIDIWAAFCAETETMLPSDKWFDGVQRVMLVRNVDEDRHSQVATWLLGRAVNFRFSSKSAWDSSRDTEVLERLKSDLSAWEIMGSDTTKPIMQCAANQAHDSPFPRLLFSNESSMIAYIMFHTAMILILEFESSHEINRRTALRLDMYQHAQTMCGIIETNNHTSCLVHSVQPLWICSKYLETKAEKFTVLELFAQIEQRTGWKTRWRSDELRKIWNLC